MKTPHQVRVERAMKLAGQVIPDRPTQPSIKERKLRGSLILEEALETIRDGLGLQVHCDTEIITERGAGFAFVESMNCPFNMVEAADGCSDLSVVTIGTLSTLGLRDAPLLVEVDNNNIAKFKDGPIMSEEGKYLKPPGHQPPDIQKVLVSQGWSV